MKQTNEERIEAAAAIIAELLARFPAPECREQDEAVAAAMAWLAGHNKAGRT